MTGGPDEGDPKRVSRTVPVEMNEARCLAPAEIELRRGETVRFLVRNAGTQLHELVLGTSHELGLHAEQAQKYPGMEHDEPYMAHVAPGKSESIVWQFTRPGEFHYGCLIPGHFEAGMIGRITVKAR